MSNEINKSFSEAPQLEAKEMPIKKWNPCHPSYGNSLSLLMQRISEQESKPLDSKVSFTHISLFLSSSQPETKRTSLNPFPSAMRFVSKSISDSNLTKKEGLFHLKQIQKADLFQDYSQMVLQLQNKEGFPWDEIKKLHHPILIEQLLDLISLCDKKLDKQESDRSNAISFALQLIKIASEDSSNKTKMDELLNEVHHIIGQWTFLIDQHPNEAVEIMKLTSCSKKVTQIQSAFSSALSSVQDELQKVYDAHRATRLQSPEIAIWLELSNAIAKMLITETGALNIGIIDTIADTFLDYPATQQHYGMSLSDSLSLIKSSSKFRSMFKKIQAPISHKLPSNEIIRTTLKLPLNAKISDLNTKQTLLIAMLSHLRQGSAGSCFATSVAIKMLSSHQLFCLKDLSQLLEEGKLIRKMNDSVISIPFLKHISDEDLDKIIEIDSKGFLIVNGKQGNPIGTAPGIQAIFRALNIQQPQEILDLVIKKLMSDPSHESVKISIEQLIKTICEVTLKALKLNVHLSQLFSKACFAFSSQTAQPLLKVWENAIAGTAETHEGGMIKSEIFNAISHSLQVKLNQLQIQSDPKIEEFLKDIRMRLISRIELRYDPTVGRDQNSLSHSREGGFVLYDNQKRIDSAQLFQTLMIDLLKNSTSNIETALQKELIEFVKTDEFLCELLLKFHLSNQHVPDLKNHYTELKFTPWVSRAGNNSKQVLQVFLDSKNEIHKYSLICNAPLDLLTTLLDHIKKMGSSEKGLYGENPNYLTLARIPRLHSFSLLFGHPSFKAGWQSDIKTDQWIYNNIIEPGTKVANSQVTHDTREALIHLVEQRILPTFLPKVTREEFQKQVKTIPENISIKKYRDSLIDIFYKLHGEVEHKVVQQLDTMLCHSLPKERKTKLFSSIIHFADTNWCRGVNDIHLGFMINPGSGELEVWEVFDDNSFCIALDQKNWVGHKEWEFFSLPDPILNSEY